METCVLPLESKGNDRTNRILSEYEYELIVHVTNARIN